MNNEVEDKIFREVSNGVKLNGSENSRNVVSKNKIIKTNNENLVSGSASSSIFESKIKRNFNDNKSVSSTDDTKPNPETNVETDDSRVKTEKPEQPDDEFCDPMEFCNAQIDEATSSNRSSENYIAHSIFNTIAKTSRKIPTDQQEKNKKDTQFVCDECNKTFSNKFNLSQHKLTVHTDQRSFVCNVCNASFGRKNTLNQHMIVHTGLKPYLCEECNMSFAHKGTLERHKLIHTDTKPFTCDICNKQFRHKSVLDEHKVLHTGIKSHVCELCDRAFTDKKNFARHQLVHSGERLYVCFICNKAFGKKITLDRHIMIHSDERPYSCDVCDKKFRQKHVLTIHRRLHTGEKPYKCDFCPEAFIRNRDLAKHRALHNTTTESSDNESSMLNCSKTNESLKVIVPVDS